MTDVLSGDALSSASRARDANEGETRITILVCGSCRHPGQPSETWPRPGSALVEATRAAARDSAIDVKQVGCLGNCKRGLSAAILRDGSWSYIFGELGTESAADLVAGATLFSRSTDGFMPFRDRPEALKRGLIARVPTAANLKDLT